MGTRGLGTFRSAVGREASAPSEKEARDLRARIRKFGRRLRCDFAPEIQRDPRGFRQHVLRFLKAELPLRSGRPTTETVERHPRMGSHKAPYCMPYQAPYRMPHIAAAQIRHRRGAKCLPCSTGIGAVCRMNCLKRALAAKTDASRSSAGGYR